MPTPAPPFEDLGMTWRRLPCPRSELRLDLVLRCGQSFRWSPRQGRPGEWLGAMAGKAWVLAQDAEQVLYKCFPESSENDEGILRDYFQLEVSRSS